MKKCYSGGCLFCQFIKGEKDRPVVYEDEHTFVMLDARPATTHGGHSLVMPKKHYELITDIPDEELACLAATIKKVSKALLKCADGVNVLQNNKRIAGQFQPHVHFHIIPRYKGDGIQIEVWKERNYKDGEMEDIARRIRKLLKE